VWQRKAARVSAHFVRHIVPAVIKPVHALWNELIGFIFLCMGVIFGFYTARYAIKGDSARMFVAGLATCIMLGYGISSFRRARKISRS
jgi:vacuolar-type H+-ATPase subunit I/STV1